MQQPYLEGFRLSVEQKRFWNLEEQGSNLTSQLVLLVNGCLEIEKLTLSLRSVVAQNEALRLSFEYLPGMKTPVQILNDFEPLELKRLDAKNRPKDLAIESTLQEEREAFNLSKGLASVLISFSENEHALLITIPAISADTRSLINIAQRLSNFYLGIDSETEEIGFIQFAEWQNELLSSEDAAEGKSYWQKMHQQEFGRVFLPLEKKQNTHTAFNFSSESRQIGCYHTMKETVAEINSSVENFLVAAFQLLLARLSEESNFVLAYRTEG
ncbi:MAG: hypothetical protein JNN15_12385, partial [Blastocatellia bacterium]|nr:hypothetical protein [Blastocatellia bacterium]